LKKLKYFDEAQLISLVFSRGRPIKCFINGSNSDEDIDQDN
jgi:hypothetical protein